MPARYDTIIVVRKRNAQGDVIEYHTVGRNGPRIWRTGEGTFRAHYLTPEAIQGGPPRPCIDQYQAGLLAYRLLTGRLPFEGDDLMRVVFAHMTETPPDPREFAPDLTHMQVAAILRALEKEPDRRFPSIAEFASALLDG